MVTGEAGEEEWKNEQPIPDDLIIADEFSMVDMYLADKLFASIKSGARLVLVGDKDQIESVGPGKVFQEIIDSGVFPVTVLDECFRQEGNSTISQNAIKINKNQLDLVFDDTFQFIPASTPEEASRKIQKIYRKEVLQRNGSLEEVQVMSPLRKDTEAGTDALNLVLRDIANPKRFGYPEITNGRNTYREGDRVMQTKNNDEVANGDIGEVIGIFRKDQKMVMRVDFGDGRVMEYQEEDYWPLTLAYAITVHKAQGSEYPMAILPMLPCFRWMLRRNISALATVNGIYEEGISREKAFQEILKAVYEKGYEKSKNEKDFLLKESEIVKACREPSVIEIQEPAMIEKPGTLTRLNSLFDDGAVTDLVNGEQIRRNPDTIVIMTTNLDYVGCQNFNQSVLSRMNLIQPKEALTEEEMAKRAMKRTGFKNKELLSFMAATVCKIHEYLIEQDITDGVCGYRELENWVLSYMVSNDLRRSAWTALLSKASMDREEQGTMERIFLLPHCDVD